MNASSINQRLNLLNTLFDDWDQEGSDAPLLPAIECARKIALGVMDKFGRIRINPMCDGGISIELWRAVDGTGRADYLVDVFNSGEVVVLFDRGETTAVDEYEHEDSDKVIYLIKTGFKRITSKVQKNHIEAAAKRSDYMEITLEKARQNQESMKNK